MTSGMLRKIYLLLLAASLCVWSQPRAVHANGGGAGSKGGVVLACFSSDPTKFMVRLPGTRVYVWPAAELSDSVGLARVFNAVNHLRLVQVAEYYLATAEKSWQGSEDVFAVSNPAYRLHPLLYLLNELPASKRAILPPKFMQKAGPGESFQVFPIEKLDKPHLLTPADHDIIRTYAEDETGRLLSNRSESARAFVQIYRLLAYLFRGLPGFSTRLEAAHEELGLVYENESNMSGSKSDQWDSRNLTALTSLPNPPTNCLWMTAADRVTNHETGRAQLVYDRYLWTRMDLFQRALLQLHEEIYYLGSDSLALGHQKNVESTRFMLTRFLRGERSQQDRSGDFVSSCAYYDTSVNRRAPTVKIIESSACLQVNGNQVRGPEVSFLPVSMTGSESLAFVNDFLCLDSHSGCSPEKMKVWEKLARYYGPYSSNALAALFLHDAGFFGRYSTIDLLTDKRDRATSIADSMLKPYEKLWGFCEKGGYGYNLDPSSPPPHRYNARRLTREERLRREIFGRGDPVITKADVLEIEAENQTFRDLKAKERKGSDSFELQRIAQGLLNDYPDDSLATPLSALLKLTHLPESFADLDDLEPNFRNGSQLEAACNDIRGRRGELRNFLGRMSGLNFYRVPADALEAKVPR